MSGKMRWWRAANDAKRSISIRDELEFEGRDRASRWLEKKLKKAKTKQEASHGQVRKADPGER